MAKIENEGVNDELVEEEGNCFYFVFIWFFDVFIPFLFRFLTFLFCFYFVFCLAPRIRGIAKVKIWFQKVVFCVNILFLLGLAKCGEA